MYVCTYVHIYVCMYVCTYVRMYAIRLVQYCHNMDIPGYPILSWDFPRCQVGLDTTTNLSIPGYPVPSWDMPRWQICLVTPTNLSIPGYLVLSWDVPRWQVVYKHASANNFPQTVVNIATAQQLYTVYRVVQAL